MLFKMTPFGRTVIVIAGCIVPALHAAQRSLARTRCAVFVRPGMLAMPLVQIVLIDKRAGEIVASTR
jgi:hypothetical protein